MMAMHVPHRIEQRRFSRDVMDVAAAYITDTHLRTSRAADSHIPASRRPSALIRMAQCPKPCVNRGWRCSAVNTGQIASIPAVTVPLGASLEQAAQLMLRWHTGAVVVTENIDGHLRVAGILTDRDIVRARLKHSGALSTLNVADVMTAEPLVLEAHLGIDNALRNLQARAVRRAPVVDRDGALLGVVSTDDLLRFIAAELTGLAQLVTRQTRTSLP